MLQTRQSGARLVSELRSKPIFRLSIGAYQVWIYLSSSDDTRAVACYLATSAPFDRLHIEQQLERSRIMMVSTADTKD